MHSTEWLQISPVWGGYVDNFIRLFPGVPLFFLVSGFLITDSYINSKNLEEYFMKRGLRIYPALFVNILVLEIAMYIGGNFNEISIFKYIWYLIIYICTAAMGIAGFLVGMKFEAIYNLNGFFNNYPSGVLWTLSVELSFYLVLPIIICFKKTVTRNLILLSLFFISLTISAIADENFYQASNLNKVLELICLPFLWIFIIGIMIRLYWLKLKNLLVKNSLYYFVFYLIFCYLSVNFGDGLGDYKKGLGFFTVVQIILLSFAIFGLAFSFTNFKIARKTDLSYSTYLYHMLVVQILISFGFIGSWFLYFVVVGFTFIIAYISWKFIEKPMLNLKQIKGLK